MKQGPQTPFAEKIHSTKYREAGETFRESRNRIAKALADSDEHYFELRELLLAQRFLPAGRIQAAIGSSRRITPYNCYVSGTIEDSYTNGSGSIMARAHEAADTMRLGGGIGYDFSTLRPRGSLIKKLGSQSGGPIPFMEIFDAVCRATSSSGHRRGAQMGVMRIDHPDVEEFIRAKHDLSKLLGFNISVAITDEFMQAVQAGNDFNLRFEGQTYKQVNAAQLFDLLMRSTYDYAEPGVLFIDTINKRNNLYYCESIAATNPCGEQPLPPYGACLLGSFNLTAYLEPGNSPASWKFNWVKFFRDIPVVVLAMDNVVDRAIYPLYEQEKEAISKRRMGLGVTGVANTIEALGHPYGSDGFVANLEIILRGLRDEA
jgi:ribonucleoside-diphosphate reductase alpha chain